MPKKANKTLTDRLGGFMWGTVKQIGIETLNLVDTVVDETVFAVTGHHEKIKKKGKRK